MAGRAEFRILVGIDGSAHARAALETVVQGPWPEGARVRALAARQRVGAHRSLLLASLDGTAQDAIGRARRALARQWPDAEAVVVDKAPVRALLKEAATFKAEMIVVGWRGYGASRGLLMGSVSRGVVRGAKCAVLVTKRRPRSRIEKVLLAFDASSNAKLAVRLLARLSPGPNGHVTLVQVVQTILPTGRGPAIGGIRASIAHELKRLNAQRLKTAESALKRAGQQLNRTGWRTSIVLRTGEPLRELTEATKSAGAELIVVGARGASHVRHLLIGSVAEGIVNHSAVPVLLAR